MNNINKMDYWGKQQLLLAFHTVAAAVRADIGLFVFSDLDFACMTLPRTVHFLFWVQCKLQLTGSDNVLLLSVWHPAAEMHHCGLNI